MIIIISISTGLCLMLLLFMMTQNHQTLSKEEFKKKQISSQIQKRQTQTNLQKFENYLSFTGLTMESFFFFSVTGLLVGGLMDTFILHMFPVVLSLFGLITPLAFTYIQTMRTRTAFENGLIDALEVWSSSIRAGQTPTNAIEDIATNEHLIPVIQKTFQSIRERMAYNHSLLDELHRVSDVMDSNSLRNIVVTIAILMDTGGNIPKYLDSIAESLRSNQRQQKKLKALTKSESTQALVLGLMPLFLFLVMELWNPSMYEPLLASTIGSAIFICCWISILLGNAIVAYLTKKV